MTRFISKAIIAVLAVSAFAAPAYAKSCNDMMNSRPVNNAMKFEKDEWRFGKLARSVNVQNAYGVKGNRKSGTVVGYVSCEADAGTPVAVKVNNPSEMVFTQCGNPVKGIALSDVEFDTVTVDRIVYQDRVIPGPERIVYQDRPQPYVAPVSAQSYSSQPVTHSPQQDTMLALATSSWASMDASPMAAMERTVVDGVFGVAQAATLASLWPKPKATQIDQTVNNYTNGTPNPGDLPDGPGRPTISPVTPNPGDLPDGPGRPTLYPNVPTTGPAPVQPYIPPSNGGLIDGGGQPTGG